MAVAEWEKGERERKGRVGVGIDGRIAVWTLYPLFRHNEGLLISLRLLEIETKSKTPYCCCRGVPNNVPVKNLQMKNVYIFKSALIERLPSVPPNSLPSIHT